MTLTFEDLTKIDVNDKIEEKQGKKYLSWTYAWGMFKKTYPEANYEILEQDNGLPFFESSLGIMVKTRVTANNETLSMWLPVMDGANKAMKHEAYEHKQGNSKKQVDAATMFDINKTIMRCLVKNIAMFGLGLYVFSGEDMPFVDIINAEQLSQLTKFASQNNVNIAVFNEAFGIQKLSQLYEINFENALIYMQQMADAQHANNR